MKIYIILLIILFSCSKKNDYDLPFQFWSPEMIDEFKFYEQKSYDYFKDKFGFEMIECPDTCIVELKNEKLILSGVPGLINIPNNHCDFKIEYEAAEYTLIKKDKWLEIKEENTRKLTKEELKSFDKKQTKIIEKLRLDYLDKLGITKDEKKDFFRKILGKNYLINQYKSLDFNQDGINDYLVFFSYPVQSSYLVHKIYINTGFAIIISKERHFNIEFIDYNYINTIGSQYLEFQIHKTKEMNLIILSIYDKHRCNVLQSIDLISFK